MNKRFFIDKDSRTIVDNVDDSYCECVESYEAKEYCNKLNTLNNENKQLKKFIKRLTNSNGEIILIDGRGYLKSYVKSIIGDLE